MEIKANTRDLEAALKVVTNTYQTTGTDISGHYLFRVTEGEAGRRLEILSHKQPGRVFSSCPCVSEDDGKKGETLAFTIEASRFDSLIGVLKDAVLTLRPAGPIVVCEAPSPWGKVEFKSLDPDKFMSWDEMYAKATLVGEVPADHLVGVFNFAKLFISNLETKNPGMLVTEARDGLLLSTNTVTVTTIRMPQLASSSMRIHNKDVSPLLKFLAASERSLITVSEGERHVFFRRDDGALFGASRFMSAFPKLGLPPEEAEDAHWWKLSKERMLATLPFLMTASDKLDPNLYLRRQESEIRVSVDCVTGGRGHIMVPLIDSGSKDGAKDLPSDGFVVNRDMLRSVLSQTDAAEVVFGLNATEKGGFLRIQEERESGNYRMISTWLPK